MPYDEMDPRKQHFPLVSGEINFRKADEIVRYLMILFCFFTLYLTKLQPTPTFFLFLAISGGLLYDYFNKVTPLAVLGVATAWGILPIISYYSTTSSFSPVIMWVTIYSWVQVFIQISVLGWIKDIEAPRENNLMRKLGCRVEGDQFICSSVALSYAIVLKAFHMFLLIMVLGVSNSSPLAWFMSFLFYWISWIPYRWLMNPKWERDKVLGRCVLNEAFAFFAVMPAIQGVIGWGPVFLMIVYPPIWVFVWMRLQWKEWRLGPKV